MKMIKLKRDSVYGKKGQTVQVLDEIAEQYVKDGFASIVKADIKSKGSTVISNKAMSA